MSAGLRESGKVVGGVKWKSLRMEARRALMKRLRVMR